MIEVELPDGTIAEFPEGTSPDVIKGALQKRYAAPQQAVPQAPNNARSEFEQLPWYAKAGQAADDTMRMLANGMTFGYADKLAGYMNGQDTSGLITGQSPVDRERELTEQARQRAGSAAMPTEILGSVLTAGGAAKQGLTLAGRGGTAAMNGLKGLAARSGLMASEGAGYGALSAAGNDQDIGRGAMIGAAGGGLGNAAGEGATAAISKALGMFNKAPKTMDADALKQAAQAAYGRADDAGVIYSPDAIKRVTGNLKGDFADFGFHPQLQPGANVALSELERLGGQNVTLKGLDTARKIAGNAYQPMNKSNNALTGKITGAIDDLVQNPQAGDIIAGNGNQASAAIKEARDMYGRSAKMDKLDELFTRGELNASTSGSGGNLQNATRQQLKRVLMNKGWDRGFKPDEIKAIKSFAKGTTGQNILRSLGAMSPMGNGLGKMLWSGAAVGGAVTSPATLIPMAAGAAVTSGAKKGAEVITRKNFEKLQSLIASGGNAAALKSPKNAAQKAIERNKAAIARALMMSGVLAGSQAGQP